MATDSHGRLVERVELYLWLTEYQLGQVVREFPSNAVLVMVKWRIEVPENLQQHQNLRRVHVPHFSDTFLRIAPDRATTVFNLQLLHQHDSFYMVNLGSAGCLGPVPVPECGGSRPIISAALGSVYGSSCSNAIFSSGDISLTMERNSVVNDCLCKWASEFICRLPKSTSCKVSKSEIEEHN